MCFITRMFDPDQGPEIVCSHLLQGLRTHFCWAFFQNKYWLLAQRGGGRFECCLSFRCMHTKSEITFECVLSLGCLAMTQDPQSFIYTSCRDFEHEHASAGLFSQCKYYHSLYIRCRLNFLYTEFEMTFK